MFMYSKGKIFFEFVWKSLSDITAEMSLEFEDYNWKSPPL